MLEYIWFNLMSWNYYNYNSYINDFNYNKIIVNILNINLKYKLEVMHIKFNHKSNNYCN
jgi:hypothetical protein